MKDDIISRKAFQINILKKFLLCVALSIFLTLSNFHFTSPCDDSFQWSFGGGTPGNGIPIVIRIVQQTTMTDEGKTAKSVPIVRSVPIVSHLPNDN
jgi:hypothetical protein